MELRIKKPNYQILSKVWKLIKDNQWINGSIYPDKIDIDNIDCNYL